MGLVMSGNVLLSKFSSKRKRKLSTNSFFTTINIGLGLTYHNLFTLNCHMGFFCSAKYKMVETRREQFGQPDIFCHGMLMTSTRKANVAAKTAKHDSYQLTIVAFLLMLWPYLFKNGNAKKSQ